MGLMYLQRCRVSKFKQYSRFEVTSQPQSFYWLTTDGLERAQELVSPLARFMIQPICSHFLLPNAKACLRGLASGVMQLRLAAGHVLLREPALPLEHERQPVRVEGRSTTAAGLSNRRRAASGAAAGTA